MAADGVSSSQLRPGGQRGPRAALPGQGEPGGPAPGRCCCSGQRGSISSAAKACPKSSTKHDAGRGAASPPAPHHLSAPRPALLIDPASAVPLGDPLPQSGDKGSGAACSCRAHLPLPGLCSITGAKFRSGSSNLQRGGRGGGGRGSGQAKAGVSWCTDLAFVGGEMRQRTWSCHPKQNWSAA